MRYKTTRRGLAPDSVTGIWSVGYRTRAAAARAALKLNEASTTHRFSAALMMREDYSIMSDVQEEEQT